MAQIVILEVARKRLVTFLHRVVCFGVKMSDKLLTFSRHKNKTRNAATLGPASWQEEHQVLAIPANQRTSRAVRYSLAVGSLACVRIPPRAVFVEFFGWGHKEAWRSCQGFGTVLYRLIENVVLRCACCFPLCINFVCYLAIT